MTCRGVDRLRMACGRAVTAAIVGCAEVRASFDHFARNLDAGVKRVVARGFSAPAWVFRNAARLRRVSLVLWRIPVGRPLPDVADHVVHAVAVNREGGDGRRALEAVLLE